MFTPDPPPKITARKHTVYIRTGLEDQDDNLDILQTYFKELQTMTVETSMDADLDLLTFALSAHYFGVIMMEEFPCDTQNKDGEGSRQVAPEIPSKLSGSAEPRPAIIDVPPPITEEEFLALSENEKFERWLEAFQARMKGQCGPDLEFDDGLDDVRSRRDAAMAEGHADKGKRREPQRRDCNPFPVKRFTAESISHLINWPEDTASDDGGPPSTLADDESFIWADGESSTRSPTPAFNYGGHGYEDGGPPSDDNFGREYLEPDMGLAGRLPEIPQDPELQKFIRESAIKFRDQLRARTVHLYEKRKAELAQQRAAGVTGKQPAAVAPPAPMGFTQKKPPFVSDPSTSTKTKPIGLVYITASQNFSDPLHVGECNFGIYIAQEHWDKGRVSEVIHTVIEDAFKDHNCHRLQAILIDHQDTFDYLNLYASAGFRHEGIRRRAFFSPVTTEWKDVTYLAILATEWVHDNNTRSSRARLLPSSLWDEILSRHQREQEEFVWMEERKFKNNSSLSRKRTSSLETIREAVPTALSRESGAESAGFSTDTSSSSSGVSSHKRRKFALNGIRTDKKGRRPSFSSSESGLDSDWEVPLLNDSELAGLRICDPGPSRFSFARRSARNSSASSSSSWAALSD